MTPQARELLAALQRGPLTSMEVLKRLGIARAAARVHELREALKPERLTVVTEMVDVTTRKGKPARVARYSIMPEEAQGSLFDGGLEA